MIVCFLRILRSGVASLLDRHLQTPIQDVQASSPDALFSMTPDVIEDPEMSKENQLAYDPPDLSCFVMGTFLLFHCCCFFEEEQALIIPTSKRPHGLHLYSNHNWQASMSTILTTPCKTWESLPATSLLQVRTRDCEPCKPTLSVHHLHNPIHTYGWCMNLWETPRVSRNPVAVHTGFLEDRLCAVTILWGAKLFLFPQGSQDGTDIMNFQEGVSTDWRANLIFLVGHYIFQPYSSHTGKDVQRQACCWVNIPLSFDKSISSRDWFMSQTNSFLACFHCHGCIGSDCCLTSCKSNDKHQWTSLLLRVKGDAHSWSQARHVKSIRNALHQPLHPLANEKPCSNIQQVSRAAPVAHPHLYSTSCSVSVLDPVAINSILFTCSAKCSLDSTESASFSYSCISTQTRLFADLLTWC